MPADQRPSRFLQCQADDPPRRPRVTGPGHVDDEWAAVEHRFPEPHAWPQQPQHGTFSVFIFQFQRRR